MKTKIFPAFLFIALAAHAFSAAAPKPNYKGYKHKGVLYGETLPNGVKDLGGGLLSNENYGVSRFSKGKSFMLWLEKITTRDREGVPSWEVKDVLEFSDLKKNQEFLFSYSSGCTLKGKSNLDLVALAEVAGKNKTYKIKKAWLANVKKEKFEKIDVKNVKCEPIEPDKK
jgi:hypothetical protein